MKRIMQVIAEWLRLAVLGPPHPVVAEAERAADAAEQQSEEVDEFAKMVAGMRGRPRPQSKRRKGGKGTRRT